MKTKQAMRWNFKERYYETETVPLEAKAWGEPEDTVRCASCARWIHFGDCYTSRRHHTQRGAGYAVCPKCYREEVEEEERANGQIDKGGVSEA